MSWSNLIVAAVSGGAVSVTLVEILRWVFFGRQNNAATLAGAAGGIAEAYGRFIDELEEVRERQKATISEMFIWKKEAQERLLVLEKTNHELSVENHALKEELEKIELRLCQVEKEAKRLMDDLIAIQEIRLRELQEQNLGRSDDLRD